MGKRQPWPQDALWRADVGGIDKYNQKYYNKTKHSPKYSVRKAPRNFLLVWITLCIGLVMSSSCGKIEDCSIRKGTVSTNISLDTISRLEPDFYQAEQAENQVREVEVPFIDLDESEPEENYEIKPEESTSGFIFL